MLSDNTFLFPVIQFLLVLRCVCSLIVTKALYCIRTETTEMLHNRRNHGQIEETSREIREHVGIDALTVTCSFRYAHGHQRSQRETSERHRRQRDCSAQDQPTPFEGEACNSRVANYFVSKPLLSSLRGMGLPPYRSPAPQLARLLAGCWLLVRLLG